MKITIIAASTANLELYGLQIPTSTEITARFFVEGGNATSILLCATRADFAENQLTDEPDDTANGNGRELLDGGMIQAKLVGGTWQDIAGFENSLEIGPVAEQGYVSVVFRSALAANLASMGTVYAGLAFRVAGTVGATETITAGASIEVVGCADSSINGVYDYSSESFYTKNSGQQYLQWSGRWQLYSYTTNGRYSNAGGDASNFPVRGWRDQNRPETLPMPILQEVL